MSEHKQAVEAVARAINERFRAQQLRPDDWPTWGELLAQGHQGMHHVNATRDQARAAIAALCAMSREPGTGWRIVVSESTEHMDVVGDCADNLDGYPSGAPSDIYRAMLAAAPNPLEEVK